MALLEQKHIFIEIGSSGTRLWTGAKDIIIDALWPIADQYNKAAFFCGIGTTHPDNERKLWPASRLLLRRSTRNAYNRGMATVPSCSVPMRVCMYYCPLETQAMQDMIKPIHVPCGSAWP